MNPVENRKNRAGLLRLAAGLALSAAALAFAAREVPLGELGRAFRVVHPGYAALALAVSAAAHLFKAWRWRVLLSGQARGLGTLRLLPFVLAGQLANLFIPGRAGDWGRALAVGPQAGGRLFTLGTVALEKLLDLVAYGLLIAAALALAPLPEGAGAVAFIFVALGPLSALLLWLLVVRWAQILPWVGRQAGRISPSLWGRIEPGLTAAGGSLAGLRSGQAVAALALGSAGAWLASVLVNAALFPGFGLDLPLTAALVLLVVLQAGISANLVPGTIGVFEFLCVETLALYGVPRPDGLAFGLVLHGIVLLPLVLGAGALGLIRPGKE